MCIRDSGSDSLAACDGPAGQGAAIEPGDTNGGVTLTFDEPVYQSNDAATFTWAIADGLSPFTGDELTIECWDGDSWEPAWLAILVFSDSPSFQHLEDVNGVTADAFSPVDGSTGVIVIPPRTPDATYRLRVNISGPSNDIVHASFAVEN